MNDFIAQLAARSRNAISTLQPRLRGRFEPLSGARQALGEESVAPEFEQFVPAPARPLARETLQVSLPTAQQPGAAVAHPFNAPSSAIPFPPPPRPLVDSTRLTQFESHDEESRGDVVPKPIEFGRSTTDQVELPANRLVHDPSRTANRMTPPSDPSTTNVMGPARIESRDVPATLQSPAPHSTHRPQVEAPHEATHEAVGRSKSPFRLIPVVATIPSRDAPFAVDAQPTAAAPVIQVTIGRIEVRAVTSAAQVAPSPPPTAKHPGPSLDDYLRQRSGVRR